MTKKKFAFKTRDLKKMFLNYDRVLGLTRMSNIEFFDKSEWKTLEWQDFKELWTLQKWGGFPNHVFDYIDGAKRIVEGLGWMFSSCLFHFLKNEPLVIEFPQYEGKPDDPYVICIAPRMINVEGGTEE